MELTADSIAIVTGGSVIDGDPHARASSLANDSRTLEPGACFVALRAVRDGHDFVADAFARGATVAVVTRPVSVDPAPGSAAIVHVPDTFAALASLGNWARAQLPDAIVVGITGSTGKTSTKDLVAASLRQRFRVHATPGSFNAEIGLPITLLGAPPDTEALVLEMGARVPGDIAALCAISHPTIAVVTNVGLAHADLLGGRTGITREKGALLEALPPDGLAVLDADDAATPELAARTQAQVLRVAVNTGSKTGSNTGSNTGTDTGTDADVRAHSVALDDELRPSFTLESPWGSGRVCLSLRGAHQVVNATLAAGVALANHVPFDLLAAGLARVEPVDGRLKLLRTASGVIVLDDAYNANPASMAAALRALASMRVAGKRVAVLGEMRELGAQSNDEHAQLGRLAAEESVDLLVVVGTGATTLATAARERGLVDVIETPDAATALEELHERVGATDAVLVKGSRAVGLELVVRGLTRRAAAT
ncbi:MAG: UDP-N-acetylmuramoyl-tripeptide--D-alanyl-D-alanine ligase [Acidimicrobiia bacterium]